MATPVQAKLTNITDPAHQNAAARYEAFQAGGGGFVERPRVTTRDCRCEADGADLAITFDQSDGQIESEVGVMELPANWQQYGRLEAVVEPTDGALTLELIVIGARNRLPVRAELTPGREQTIVLDLRDLPLTAGIRATYEPAAIRLVGLWGGDEVLTDFERQRRLGRGDAEFLEPVQAPPAGPRRVIVRRLMLQPLEDDTRPFCVDRFGQRASTLWPGKVKDESELVAFRDAEKQDLDAMNGPTDRDAFGGWTGGPRFEASGFFRIEQVDGVWWMVDPLGHPFYSIGTTGVRTLDNTIPDGREALYEQLPPREGAEAEAWLAKEYRGGGVSFYRWNILRKYGSREAWRDRVCLRFGKWGFNTIANWSEEVMLDQQIVPHARTTASRDARFPLISNAFADVFDPGWMECLDQKFTEEVAPHRDNPWVIGFFVDNEGPWRNPRLLQAERDMAVRYRWRSYVREQTGDDLAAASRLLGRRIDDWSEVESMGVEDVPREGPGANLMAGFEALFAETMFSGIRQMLQRHAPNHLYLGCRFVRQAPARAIVAAAGRSFDVVSVNCYDLYPRPEQFGQWHHDSGGRPLMLGEHHFPLLSQRQLPPLYAAFTAQERRQYYVLFLRRWLEQPYSIGSHWFQHADQAATGRGQDGENQLVGFVDITDQPHAELVEAARQVTANMYEWHMASADAAVSSER